MKYSPILFLFLFTSTFAQTDKELAASLITKNKIEGHIYFLASDAMKGRETGTNEGKITAEYLANQLRSYGTKKVPGANGFFQDVPLTKTTAATTRNIVINGGKETQIAPIEGGNYHYDGAAVYLNYGLEEDYAGQDVRGKLVYIKAGSETIRGAQQMFGLMEQKKELAKKNGAIGIVELAAINTAITIAIIASVSTLLNIEATDNIDPHKRKTPPNRELIAQGIGNTLSGLIGGIAITSVVVRSSVNIEAGGQTKLTTILHGFLLLISVLFLSSVINLIPLATLSAILLLVGYKLASVSVLKKMYKKGWSQFIPFIVTILAILLTDVLVGVLIGSGLSVFFLLRGNYYNPFFIENNKLVHGEVIKLELSNEVSFLNKASIKNTLWNVPDNSKVIIDATFSSYIDLDVVEILQDFENTFAKAHNIEVNMIGLKESYDLGEEIDFVDKDLEKAKLKSTPEDILEYFIEGNKNYINGKLISHRLRNKELTDFVTISPLAVILTCIDFREPVNMLINTGMADLTILKAAGNLADKDVLKNIEIACKKQGAKLILFAGNSENSLIKEALRAHLKGEVSYLNPLIEEAVAAMHIEKMELTTENRTALADEISRFNAKSSLEKLIANNEYLYKKVEEGKIGVATAFFDRTTAKVTFSELYRPIEQTVKKQ
jgi:carbonic anhydrase